MTVKNSTGSLSQIIIDLNGQNIQQVLVDSKVAKEAHFVVDEKTDTALITFDADISGAVLQIFFE